MKFRLTYAGPLLSSKSLDNSARYKLVVHKHHIRRHFHKQLKEYWADCRLLSAYNATPLPKFPVLPEGARAVWAHDPPDHHSLPEVLGQVFRHSGFNFLPLVCKESCMSCSLHILCLYREAKSAALRLHDIDGRIKTIIRALTMPQPAELMVESEKLLGPQAGEDPFFVLLDENRRIRHLEVETDTALEWDDENPIDEAFVRLIISAAVKS